MNAFYEHHKSSIEFAYRCFDWIVLNGLIQPFQRPERVVGFFNTYRDGRRVIRRTLTEIADQFHHWVINRAERWGAPIVEAPQHERRDDFVLPYLQKTEAGHVAVTAVSGRAALEIRSRAWRFRAAARKIWTYVNCAA